MDPNDAPSPATDRHPSTASARHRPEAGTSLEPGTGITKPAVERSRSARFFHGLNRLYTRTYHDVQVMSPCPIPRRGPAILICNHISGLDPLLLQSAVSRLVVWMMAKEYYDLPQLRWFFKCVQAISVDRGGRDLAATRAAFRALDDGAVLGVFPEGRIATGNSLLRFQTGVAMMAARAKVPVYPARLEGSNRGMEMVDAFMKPNRVQIWFGKPIDVSPAPGRKADLDELTRRFTNSVASLGPAFS